MNRVTRTLTLAVLAGGLVTGAVAAPASASPAAWSAEHGLTSGGFGTGHYGDGAPTGLTYNVDWNYAADQVVVTVAPADEQLEATGPAVAVPTVAIPGRSGGGVLRIEEARRLLGEAGTGPVVFVLEAEGQPVASIGFGEDTDLTDGVGVLPTGGGGAHNVEYDFFPERRSEIASMAAGQRELLLTVPPITLPDGADEEKWAARILAAPVHGTAKVEPACQGDGRTTVRYVPESGFTGTDTVEIAYPVGDRTMIRTVDIEVGSTRQAEVDAEAAALLASYGIQPYPAAQVVGSAEVCEGEIGAGEEAEEGSSAMPGSAEETAATPLPVDVSGDHSEPGHQVPDTVETGYGAAWGLAAVGALGAGALVAARRRFGLAR